MQELYAILDETLTVPQVYPVKRTQVSQPHFMGALGLPVYMISEATDVTTLHERIVAVRETPKPDESDEFEIRKAKLPEKNANGAWYQLWDQIPLSESQKLAKLNRHRREKIQAAQRIGEGIRNGSFRFGPGTFALGGGGLQTLSLYAIAPGEREVKLEDAEGNNMYTTLSAESVVDLCKLGAKHIDDVNRNEARLAVEINNAQTIAEVLSVDIDAGWPEYD